MEQLELQLPLFAQLLQLTFESMMRNLVSLSLLLFHCRDRLKDEKETIVALIPQTRLPCRRRSPRRGGCTRRPVW